jgi:hypothetical protein
VLGRLFFLSVYRYLKEKNAWISFIILFCSFSNASEIINKYDCAATFTDKTFNYRKYYIDSVKKNYTNRDVTVNVEFIQQCFPKTFSESEAKNFIRTGQVAEAAYVLKQAESASNYRNVDSEIKKYSELLALAGEKANVAKVKAITQKAKVNADGEKRNCSTVDLSKKFGPVRNQDSVGWCYAFATADFIGFKTGFKVSATDIAVNNSTNLRNSHLARQLKGTSELAPESEGGWGYASIYQMTKRGFCKESDSPSEYFGENANLKTYIESLEKQAAKSWGRFLIETLTPVKSHSEKCSLQSPQSEQIAEVIRKSLPSDVMYNVNEKRCDGKRIQVDLPKLEFGAINPKDATDKKPIVDFIDKKLNQSLPSLLTYDESPLLGERDLGPHESVIVGRRFQNGKCEYQVRNSNGPSCAYYIEPDRCKDGNNWISREELHQWSFLATSYEK